MQSYIKTKDKEVLTPKQEEEIIKRWLDNLQRGLLKIIILRMFQKHTENNEYVVLHGYKIIDNITEHTHNAWRPSPGSIYPILAHMKKDGLIEESSVDNNHKIDSKRKEYRISQLGIRLFESLESDSPAFRPPAGSIHEWAFTRIKEGIQGECMNISLDQAKKMRLALTDLQELVDKLIREKSNTQLADITKQED